MREFPLQIGGWASGLLQYLAFVSVWPKGLLEKPSQEVSRAVMAQGDQKLDVCLLLIVTEHQGELF